MPHIHTDPHQHDLTVTAFIVRTDTPEPWVMLHMHRKHHILLPVGGHVELSETPWQAIAHELEEESGYTLTQLQVLQPKTRLKKMTKVVQHPYPLSMNTHHVGGDHFHTDIEYAFVATSDPEKAPEDGESVDIRWISGQELDKLASSEIYDNTREVYRFLLDEVLPTWEKVPTSDFLLDFPEEYK